MSISRTVLPLIAAGLYFAFSMALPARAAAPEGERTCLALAAWTEARGEPEPVAGAVMWVLENRARLPGWPSTVCGVYHQRGQFYGVRETIPRPRTYQDRAALARLYDAADLIIAGRMPDPTGGAIYFYSPAQRAGLGIAGPPAFAVRHNFTAALGPFRFYGPGRPTYHHATTTGTTPHAERAHRRYHHRGAVRRTSPHRVREVPAAAGNTGGIRPGAAPDRCRPRNDCELAGSMLAPV